MTNTKVSKRVENLLSFMKEKKVSIKEIGDLINGLQEIIQEDNDIKDAEIKKEAKIKRDAEVKAEMDRIEKEKAEIKEKENKKKIVFNIGDIRKKTYKETLKALHPDNQDTGDSDSFRLIRLMAWHFWDYEGNPRKEIKDVDYDEEAKEYWKNEKYSAEHNGRWMGNDEVYTGNDDDEDDGYPF